MQSVSQASSLSSLQRDAVNNVDHMSSCLLYIMSSSTEPNVAFQRLACLWFWQENISATVCHAAGIIEMDIHTRDTL